MTNEELNEAIRYLEEERLIVEAILYGENQDKFDSTIMLIDDVKFRESRKPLTIYDMAIKAIEKDILKEPTQTHKRYGHGNEYNDYYCPECDEFLAYEPQGNGYKSEGGWSRCRNCGQKIKWRNENK